MAIIKKTIQNLKPGKQYLLTVKPKDGDLNVALDPTMAIRFTIPSDLTIPTELGNLVIVGNYKSIMISFNPANDSDLRGYNYQVYLPEDISQSGSIYSIIGNATPYLSGFSASNVITLDVPQNSETTNNIDANTGVTTTTTIEKLYFARVQAIDTSGNTSTWTPIVASSATTLINSAHIVDLTASKITAGTIGAHEIILAGTNSILKSSNYLAATTTTGGAGWKIDGAGEAVFNQASIRSKLDIGEDLGTTDATSFHVDIDGNMWSGANSTNYSIAPFRVANTGDVTAKSLTLTGNTVLSSNSKIFLGAGNYNSLDTGFYVDSDSQFSLGDKLTWDETTLTIRGILKFPNGDDAGTFSDGDAITDGTIGGVSIDANKIYIGPGTYGASNTAFYVDNAGKFSLKDKLKWDGTTLSISGSVVITGGSTLDAINEAQDDANNAQSSANNAQNTANGKINIGGAAQDVNLNAVTIDGGKLTAGSISTNQINANYVYAGTINANNINAGTLSGHLISGGRIVIGDFSCNTDGSILTRNIEIQTGLRYRCTGTFGSSGSGVSAVVNTIGSSQQLTSPSSKREYKYNIGNIPNALNILKSVRPRIFNWKIDVFDKLDPWTDEPWTQAAKDINDFNTSYGFIAEEMAEDQPCLAVLYPPPSDLPDNQRTDIYDFSTWEPIMWKQMDFVALLVKAVQELSARVEELESR